MRVLQIVHQYPPDHIGGVELITQSLSHELARRGHEVHVATRSGVEVRSQHADEVDESGVIVHRLLTPPTPARRFVATFYDAPALRQLRALLDEIHPEVVHIQHLMGYPVVVVNDLRARRTPFIITLHDYWFACANAQLITNFDQSICDGPHPTKCGRCAMARVGVGVGALSLGQKIGGAALAPAMAWRNHRLQLALNQAAMVTTPSRFVRDKFHVFGLNTGNWRVVPYGLDVNPMPQGNQVVRDPQQLHVTYVGGLSWQKGVHVLIEAFNGLSPSAHLTIAGPLNAFPDYVAHLRKIAQHPNITFVDALTRDEVWQLLSQTDVVVVPSLWHETASLIAWEGAAASCRLIASDVGALREVAEAYSGTLVPPKDVQALREALRHEARRHEALRHKEPSTHIIHEFRSTADYASDFELIYSAAART